MKESFIRLTETSFFGESLKKLVFSRPESSEVKKVTGRLCMHRGARILALEFSLPGDTVSHKNVPEDKLSAELLPLMCEYAQVNLITVFGDAEYKRKADGTEVILGEKRLSSRLKDGQAPFERAVESLNLTKSYILSGGEDFLIKLGISDKNGRVHDKKQGKFRQINRFLEEFSEIYDKLPKDKTLRLYDLCCGKSYLSFALYYYLTERMGRSVSLYGIDLKRDVIEYCARVAGEMGFSGMSFTAGDVNALPLEAEPDMVISLHACDLATDIVINRAIALSARVILSTPCCHRYLNGKINQGALRFVTDYPHLKNKLCEAITDAIRIARLKKSGYSVSCIELTDPENTPKNTLIRAFKNDRLTKNQLDSYALEYDRTIDFVLGENKEQYLKEI